MEEIPFRIIEQIGAGGLPLTTMAKSESGRRRDSSVCRQFGEPGAHGLTPQVRERCLFTPKGQGREPGDLQHGAVVAARTRGNPRAEQVSDREFEPFRLAATRSAPG